MAVERGGVELSQHVDLVDPAVEAVGHGDIDETVRTTDRHGGLRALLCQRVETATGTTSEDDRCTRINLLSAEDVSIYTIKQQPLQDTWIWERRQRFFFSQNIGSVRSIRKLYTFVN